MKIRGEHRMRVRLVCGCLVALAPCRAAYTQSDEISYLAEYATLVADSFTQELPASLAAACKAKGTVVAPREALLGSGVQTSVQAQVLCDASTTCVVPSGTTLLMDGSLNVGALLVRGQVRWDEESQSAVDQWLCSGYVVIETGGSFNMSLPTGARHGWIYIKANGVIALPQLT